MLFLKVGVDKLIITTVRHDLRRYPLIDPLESWQRNFRIYATDRTRTISDPQKQNPNSPKALILQQRDWGLKLGHGIAAGLSSKGYRLTAVTLKNSTDRFIRSQDQVAYEQIISLDPYFDDPASAEDVEQITLDQICQELDVPSVWSIVASERSYARTYGERYPYSYRQAVDDEKAVALVKATYILFKRLLDEFNPDIVVTPNFASMQHIILSKMMQHRGIPMIGFAASKIQGLNIWVHDYTYSTGPFTDRVSELQRETVLSDNSDKARQYIKEFRRSFKQPLEEHWTPNIPPINEQLRELARVGIASMRYYRRPRINAKSKIGPSVDDVNPKLLVKNLLAIRKNRKFADRLEYTQLDSLNNFVYMPLQAQPEAAVDVMAPFFNNQLEFVRMVAQSMPGNLRLAVKDHPAMFGSRSYKYLDKLKRTPNVALLDHRETTENIFRKAELVVSTGGSSVIEAAIASLPVIQFGDLGLSKLLPNVFTHSDLTTLSERIIEVLKLDLTIPEYEKNLEAFVAAAYDVGFRADYIQAKTGSQSDQSTILVEASINEIERAISVSRIPLS
jgi:hypothetical protein